MSNPMAYILKKLTTFCQHIVSRWHPAVKAAEGRNTHLAQINRLGHNLYLKKPNRKLILKNPIFKLEKPPPFACTAP